MFLLAVSSAVESGEAELCNGPMKQIAEV